jgi:DNA repair protein RadC
MSLSNAFRPVSVGESNGNSAAIEAHHDERELGALDVYDADGCLIDRLDLIGDHDSLAIDLAHLVPRLLACSCAAVILHHRHPSGFAEPSDADIITTRAFAGLLRQLGIRLHDHLIEGGAARFSFRAQGLI